MSNFPQTRQEFDRYKAGLEARGFTVLTRWRKGLKTIRLGDIVLSEDRQPDGEESLADVFADVHRLAGQVAGRISDGEVQDRLRRVRARAETTGTEDER